MISKGVLILTFIAIVHASPIEFKQLEAEISPYAVEDINYRLNDDVLPINYKITLEPFFEDVKYFIHNIHENILLIASIAYFLGRTKSSIHIQRSCGHYSSDSKRSN